MVFAIFVAGAVIAGGAAWWAVRARRRVVTRPRWRRVALAGVAVVGGVMTPLLFLAAGYAYWYQHRAQPAAEWRLLFRGAEYGRAVVQSPRPMVIHAVSVYLDTEGLRFLVTPRGGADGRVLRGRTTSAFLEEFGVQVAINANYFLPFRSESPWDYYPHAGDGVDVCGFAASCGDVYSNKRWREGTLFISNDNRASFEAPIGEVYNAISGNGFVIRNGEARAQEGVELADVPYPRAAVGLSKGGRQLFLIVIDGKQPGYSEGATLAELARIGQGLGVHDMVRLDEGGSCALAIQDGSGGAGRAALLNVPVNNRIPYRERVVANHLGVIVDPSAGAP